MLPLCRADKLAKCELEAEPCNGQLTEFQLQLMHTTGKIMNANRAHHKRRRDNSCGYRMHQRSKMSAI